MKSVITKSPTLALKLNQKYQITQYSTGASALFETSHKRTFFELFSHSLPLLIRKDIEKTIQKKSSWRGFIEFKSLSEQSLWLFTTLIPSPNSTVIVNLKSAHKEEIETIQKLYKAL
jgi:hypothetical protein